MKAEELIEDYLVYTDNGIERVHWCNVNGVKELVSPKGKVYGYVPDYFEVKRFQKQLNEANEVIQKDFDSFDYIHSHIGSNQSNYNALMSATSYAISDIRKYLEKWGVK